MNFDQQSSLLTFQIPATLANSPDLITLQLKSVFVNISKNEIFRSSETIIVRNQPFINNYPYTQIFCVGDSFTTRWCRIRKACLLNDNLIFSFPFNVTFEDVFIIVGPKAPPHDDLKQRIHPDKIKILRRFPDVPFDDITTQLTARVGNNQMIWHNIMDFVAPTYWTMSSNLAGLTTNEWGSRNPLYGTIDRSWRIMEYHETYSWKIGIFYIKLLIDLPFEYLPTSTKCYEHINIGLRKTVIDPTRTVINESTPILCSYEIDPEGVKGLREHMLNAIHVNGSRMPNIQRPIIMIIHRRGNDLKRKIINIEDVLNATKELCPLCDVQIVDFQNRNKEKQVEFTHNASLLIGMHGSGLTHGVWLNPSTQEMPTGIYELFPYRYNCRNWYHQMADMVKIQYFAYYTKSINLSRFDTKLSNKTISRCIMNKNNLCSIPQCHDVIRDQSAIIDIEEYKRIIEPYFKQINESMKLYFNQKI
ncbi:hypothetical protein GPJ56_007252 [Histomonas meleagridis]|uniref:uncharacterized protein n=1 Tax=Histomonas meleagridis TaxID=135588 RepID=UPI003559D8DE|nr:hypothetical protein GPJ56_007252 [Histomonas meleagridis]KAH0804098.1 hypothetical protein GO595_002928 [Histomonas meleagridis]